ncbi:Putative Zn-dependent protease, contains TPR repeats [Sphingomonas guangdongensis]|uniref:Zn-dependent protease, contains TPR repeats n=1 Tax=Sphingomonas guangdongensis TaxID=1141890 RepID=A0A285QGS2_9SPHN|nr:M48 family metallopeptidase [Sphingomonas guangdongensis]SOB80664.1 Putative Zn-dependent protease, contains TPR repeats [Sphingomonas guangdongensis]
MFGPVLLAAAALLGSPAETRKVTAPPPQPYEGVYQPRGVDELGLWKMDDESESQLARSRLVVRDEALTSYVKGVLCSAVGAERCGSVRVYVMREPSFNATMSPNGTMRVYSGLLLRVRSEAELAAVLGHEFGHFERRHTLQRFKAHRSGTDLLSWAAVLASMNSNPAAQRSFGDLELSVYGSLLRFNRDNEREADLIGIGYLNASSLQPQAAARVWQNFMAETEASAMARGLKRPRFDRVAYFASHPPEAERAAYLGALALPEGSSRDDGAVKYRAAMAKWLPVFLEDQIGLNDFGGSEYLIESLAADGWTAGLWFARGELFRARGSQRDLIHAAEFYAKAIELEQGHVQAHRGLGLSLVKTGRPSEGRKALQSYLSLAPQADDRQMIELLTSSLTETPQ